MGESFSETTGLTSNKWTGSLANVGLLKDATVKPVALITPHEAVRLQVKAVALMSRASTHIPLSNVKNVCVTNPALPYTAYPFTVTLCADSDASIVPE